MRIARDQGEAPQTPGRWPGGDDTLREECGVFGVFGNEDAAALTALGLHALQHRGQEAAGIVTYDGAHFHSERRLGLVGDNFNKAEVIGRIFGPDGDPSAQRSCSESSATANARTSRRSTPSKPAPSSRT